VFKYRQKDYWQVMYENDKVKAKSKIIELSVRGVSNYCLSLSRINKEKIIIVDFMSFVVISKSF
jgi:hypothetical protein